MSTKTLKVKHVAVSFDTTTRQPIFAAVAEDGSVWHCSTDGDWIELPSIDVEEKPAGESEDD